MDTTREVASFMLLRAADIFGRYTPEERVERRTPYGGHISAKSVIDALNAADGQVRRALKGIDIDAQGVIEPMDDLVAYLADQGFIARWSNEMEVRPGDTRGFLYVWERGKASPEIVETLRAASEWTKNHSVEQSARQGAASFGFTPEDVGRCIEWEWGGKKRVYRVCRVTPDRVRLQPPRSSTGGEGGIYSHHAERGDPFYVDDDPWTDLINPYAPRWGVQMRFLTEEEVQAR